LTEHICAPEHDINNRKETFQFKGTPLVNFGPETAENGCRVFVHPPKFSHWETAGLTTWTLYSRQQANFGRYYVVARAYSLEQQIARRAHTGLCQASTYYIDDDDSNDDGSCYHYHFCYYIIIINDFCEELCID